MLRLPPVIGLRLTIFLTLFFSFAAAVAPSAGCCHCHCYSAAVRRDHNMLVVLLLRLLLVQMSSEASRLAVSIGGVEERVSSQATQVQAEKTQLDKQKKRIQACKVSPTTCTMLKRGSESPTARRENESASRIAIAKNIASSFFVGKRSNPALSRRHFERYSSFVTPPLSSDEAP